MERCCTVFTALGNSAHWCSAMRHSLTRNGAASTSKLRLLAAAAHLYDRPRRMSRTTRVPSFCVVQQAKRHSGSGVTLRRAHLLRRAMRSLAAGEPSPLASEKAFVCVGTATHARDQTKNANAFQSAAALQALPRVNVGQFVGAGAVAPARSARPRSQWCRFYRSGRVVVVSAIHELRQARPNPSIEGTSQRPLRALCAAPHVKR